MLGLPTTTELNRPLPKKALFDRFRPSPSDRKLFDEQISKLTVIHEISPQTVAVRAGEDVHSVYVVLAVLKTAECNKKNIILLSKWIDQRIVFMLQSGENARLAVYRAGKVLMSENKPMNDLDLKLIGLDIGAVWEDIIVQIGGIDLSRGTDLDSAIVEMDRREKLQNKIESLEKKAMMERQHRRKWELAEEIRLLKEEIGGIPNE